MPMLITSKPAPSSIIATRFFPMSWMSPFTVPITTLPIREAPVSASSGRRISMPAFIAFAASNTSGTNRIPSRKSIPTIRIPSTSASFRTRSGAHPRPSRMLVPSVISSASPSYRSSCICFTSSSSGSVDRSSSSSVIAGLLRACPSCPQPFAFRVDERIGGHRGGMPLAEILDLDGGALGRELHRQIAVDDPAAHRVAVGGRRDVGHDVLARQDRLLAHDDDRRIVERHARELVRAAAALQDRLEGCATLEVSLVHVDGEPEPGLERIVLGVDVLPPEPVPLFEAKGV